MGCKISDLDFADDIAPDAASAQQLLTRLATNAAVCGPDINPQETEYMVLGDLPPMHIGTQQAKQVTDNRYLGVHTDTDADITMRTGQAWATMRQHQHGVPRR